MKIRILSTLLLGLAVAACGEESSEQTTEAAKIESTKTETTEVPARFGIYKKVKLTSDLSHLSENQNRMLELLIDASKIMDQLFWKQAYGERANLLEGIENTAEREFAIINYGPWDRLDGDKPFVSGYEKKPLGAQFYPSDMTKDELAAAKTER